MKITFNTFLGRFYLDRAGQAVVRMVDAEFEYTYEYQVILSKNRIIPLPGPTYHGKIFQVDICHLESFLQLTVPYEGSWFLF